MGARTTEGLDLDRIRSAAVAAIRRDGAEALSMRSLAQELEAGVASVYHHVPDKATLLAEATNAILATVPAPSAGDWPARIAETADGFRRVLLEHPGIAPYVRRHLRELPAGAHATRSIVDVLEEAGCERSDARRLTDVVGIYVVGSVGDDGVTPSDLRRGRPSHTTAGAAPLDEATFQVGLQLLIDGIRAHLQRTRLQGRDH